MRANPSSTFVAALAAAWVALGAASAGQQHAFATLYARAEGDRVRAAIDIELDAGWHLYYKEKGHPEAIGLETKVTLGGEGIEWGEVRFPEPVRFDQSFLAPGAFILGYEHDFTLYAEGRLAAGASAEDATAALVGQTCNDVGQCTPYRQSLEVAGRGSDALFADFPSGAATDGGEIEGFGERDTGNLSATLYARAEGDVVRAAIEVEVDEGWHYYHTELGPEDAIAIPAELRLGGAGIAWTDVVWPEPEKHVQSAFEPGAPDSWAWAHEGTIVIRARGELAPGASAEDARALLVGQTCENATPEQPFGSCTQVSASLEVAGRGPDALFADAAAVQSGTDDEPPPRAVDGTLVGERENEAALEGPLGESLLAFLLAAVGWGLFALLMPCTYPMIPITISFFTKQASERGGTALFLSLCYGLGIIGMFVVIGIFVGAAIIPFATHPVTNLVIGLLFLLFALALFGVVDLRPPRFLMNAAGKASGVGGLAGVFLMGLVFVVTSFTCTAPFVGTLLSFGASTGDLGRVALGMATFGATMAIPFVFLSLVPGRVQAMPRAGEWMHVLKVTLGFVEVAAALKFISNSDLVWHWQAVSRELFLAAWALIFLAAALFLFGIVRLQGESGEISPKRLVAAVCVLLFSGYCWYGIDHKLDWVMNAIVPPYSSRIAGAGPAGGASGTTVVPEHEIVADDFDAAIVRAREQGKHLLVNFTGHT